MSTRRSGRSIASKASTASTDTPYSMSRPRRTASGADAGSMASLSRAPVSSSTHQSLRLTVKLPTSKLRAATGLPPSPRRGQPASAHSRDYFPSGQIVEGKRARNVKKSYVLESDSDEEDEEMEDVDDEDDDDEEDSAEDDEEEADEDEDAAGEEDAEGDVEMEVQPPPPTIKISKAEKPAKQVISLKPAGRGSARVVEQKVSETGSDDEELSDLESEMEDDEEGMQLGGEEDADGEDEEIEGAEEDEEEDDEDDLDSDDETPGGGSRASTPDITKLTKRQRARLEEGGSGHLLALPDEVQVKKHLTAEEHAMRRAEMARRRKNLSEKRNEEEKMETINKLLKKQAPKTNARRRELNGTVGDVADEGEVQKPNPSFVRWVSNRAGNRIGVPEEWIDGPVGAVFGKSNVQVGKMVGEVQSLVDR